MFFVAFSLCFCDFCWIRWQVGPNSFELVNLLGRGSFGEVFQVKHKRTGKAYAMKDGTCAADFDGQNQ